MAQEILVIYKEPLTRDMIEEGSRFLEALERNKFAFTAAFWLWESERNRWRMMLAVPNVREEGPLKSYRRLANITRRETVDESVSFNMAVLDSKDPLILELRRAVKRKGVRWTGPLNGTYIEDSYVYRTGP